jgi:hypothetical protein
MWCAAGTVIALMAFARHKGVNLSVLGIGVDFLQVRYGPVRDGLTCRHVQLGQRGCFERR